MSNQEEQAYILGTEKTELHRLGLQHQVWASEARRGWELAGFGPGQTILDLGCGPGFCIRDLAYITGTEGEVIGVDKSAAFISFVDQIKKVHELNISALTTDFDAMQLKDESLDGIYCRWAMAWVPNPEEIIKKLEKALKPGGVFIAQEYYDWSVFQFTPYMPNLFEGVQKALKSFKEMPGNINIGRNLPEMFYDQGLEVTNIRPMSKLATPDDLTWQWPKTFLQIYLPKLVSTGYLTHEQVRQALEELIELEFVDGATCLCPQMVEVIAMKI